MKPNRRLLLVILLAAPAGVYGWGEEGHKIVADIAARDLTPQAAAKVKDLLDGQSMTDVAAWADTIRSRPEYKWTAPLHYVNLPPGSEAFDFQRDCPTGECVVGAVYRFIGVLRDPTADRSRKSEALKFLIHFVGDVHQPLHVSHARDKGGNDIKVEFFYDRTNLHAVWDEFLLRRARQPWQEYAEKLYSRVTAAQRQRWVSRLDPGAWATESYRLAVSHAYVVPKDGRLDQEYFDRCLPIVEERLSMAGVRLAALLNAIFADGAGLPAPPRLATRPVGLPTTSAASADVPTASTRPAGNR